MLSKLGIRNTHQNTYLIGLMVCSLFFVSGIIGCSSSGDSEPKPVYRLTGYNGVESSSSNSVSALAASDFQFYSEFPWFVNMTFQVYGGDSLGYPGLTVNDFKVLEDNIEVGHNTSEMNVRKRDTLPSNYTYTLKTVLFLDNTPSEKLNLSTILEAAQVIVDAIDSKQQQEIAIMAYDSDGDPYLVTDFTKDVSALNKYLNIGGPDAIQPSHGTTNFYGAVIEALSLWEDDPSPADTSFVQGVLVVLTDGKDTSSLNDVSDAIAERGNKQVVTVPVGLDIPESDLNDLKQLGNMAYYYVPAPDNGVLCQWTLTIQQRIIAYADSFYWLRYKSPASGGASNTNHQVNVSILNNGNVEADGSLNGNFNSAEFFSGTAGIYFDATTADPDGISEKDIMIQPGQASATAEVTAVTYSRESNNPSQYEWTSQDESVVKVEAQGNNGLKAIITVVAPGETTITVTDKANNVTKSFTVKVKIINPSYGILQHEVESAGPWFVGATFQVRKTEVENHQWDWVTNLIREDFNILEDGALVDREDSEVNLRKHDDMPSNYSYTLRTVLLIDNSPSVGTNNLNLIKLAAKSFVKRAFENNPLDNSDQGPLVDAIGKQQQEIAIWTFTEAGDSIQVWFDFGTGAADLYKAIDDIPQGYGPTDFYGGMIDALNLWENNEAPHGSSTDLQQGVLIALTDGNHSYQGFYSQEQVLGEIRDKQVVCVGVGDDLVSAVNDDLKAFGNDGFYSVPNPSQIVNVTVKADVSGVESIISYRALQKTMIDIQDKIMNYANSFYWLDYKSYLQPKSDCDVLDDLEITINNNGNDQSNNKITGQFPTCEFFPGEVNKIYVNSTVTNPWGEDGPIDLVYYIFNGNIYLGGSTFPLEAFTYKHENEPEYEWQSDNEDIVKINVNENSYAFSRAILVTPQVPHAGSCDIRITDIVNNSIKSLRVNVTRVDLDPVLYYPFNGNANDFSGNGFNGQVQGAQLDVDRFGKPDRAYAFDKSHKEYIAISGMHYGSDSGAITDDIKELSVCAWVKASPEANLRDARIISFDHFEFWDFTLDEGYLGLRTSIPAGRYDSLESENTLNDGKWHFVCGTFNNQKRTKKLYVDGVLVSTGIMTPVGEIPPPTGTDRYGFIGVRSIAETFDGLKYDPSYFGGSLDNIIVFHQELPELAIKELMNLEE